jgi:dTDP-4-amino-4,6-dideoxygalactose transaminase
MSERLGRSPVTRSVVTDVPFLDLGPSHAPLKEAILDEIAAVIDSGRFVNGAQVGEFERAYAEYTGTRDCVGLASGLDALRLGLLAAGIRRGDEVVTAANTFIASLEAITQAGGRPVLVDASEDDYNIDAEALEAAIGPRTRFLIPVHLYGQVADMRRLRDVASRLGLTVIEDACQAHGASRDGVRAGTAGALAAFSFYPGKNLGAMGDAGAAVTDDPSCSAVMRSLREHGQSAKYVHEREGYTARLDTIQAAVLLLKLGRLDEWNDERRAVARAYDERLDRIGDLRLPPVPEGSEPVWHLYVVRTAEPARLAAFLSERGIGTGRHYPIPPHLSQAYEWLGYRRGAFPVTEALAAECLSLPIFPGMSDEQVDAVVAGIKAYFAHG